MKEKNTTLTRGETDTLASMIIEEQDNTWERKERTTAPAELSELIF